MSIQRGPASLRALFRAVLREVRVPGLEEEAEEPAGGQGRDDDEGGGSPGAGPAEGRDEREGDGRKDGFPSRKAEGRDAHRPAANALRQAGCAHHARMAQHALAEQAQGEEAQAQHDDVGRKERLTAAAARPSSATVA